jgi:hypothetical protein
MNLTLYLYVFAAAIMVISGTVFFFKSGNSISGGIYGIGTLALSIFFGTRWFLPSGVDASAGSQWPPVINVCPDFLSLYTLIPSGATAPKVVCIDTIGVSKNGNLKVWSDPTQTDASYYFDPTPTPPAGKTLVATLCDNSSAMGLTWEGIYDGTSCTTKNVPPTPPAAPAVAAPPAV